MKNAMPAGSDSRRSVHTPKHHVGVEDTITTIRLRYRAYPNKKQAKNLSRLFGCCRVVVNDAIRARREARSMGLGSPPPGWASSAVTAAKREPDRAFLGEVSAVALQQALADLDRAYGAFFRSLAGERKGRKVGSPRLKSRRDRRQTARFTRNARFKILPGRDECEAVLRLPKVGGCAVRHVPAVAIGPQLGDGDP